MMSGINLVILVILAALILFIIGIILLYNWNPGTEEIGLKSAFYSGCTDLVKNGCGSLGEIKTPKGRLDVVCQKIYGNDVDTDTCKKACGCSV